MYVEIYRGYSRNERLYTLDCLEDRQNFYVKYSSVVDMI